MMNHIKTTICSIITIIIALSPIDVHPSSESSHEPIISARGWFIDPTYRDLLYLDMLLKVKGDKIIEYETPFLHEIVKCEIPYRKMTAQERRQMRFIDSKGRSYELEVGDCQYIAQVGKLTVYFMDWGFGKKKLYSQEEVDTKSATRIVDFVKSKITSAEDNPNPLGKMVISFIVNRDGVISDVEILESPDQALNSDVIQAIKGKKIEPAHDRLNLPLKVDCKFEITLKVKPKMTKQQELDKYIQYWNGYFSKKQEDIDYARKNYINHTQEKSSPEIPTRLNDLYTFVVGFPLSKVIKGVDVNIEWGNGTIDKWEKIKDMIFKDENSSKSDNQRGVYINKGAYKAVLKQKEDEKAIQYLLNVLNDMIYLRIIECAVFKEFGINFYIPQTLNEVAEYYTKKLSDEEFKKFFEQTFRKRVDELTRDPDFKKNYSQWEESYYLAQLGYKRNIILNKNKTKIIGRYYINNPGCDRSLYFNNKKPYMLYPLQNDKRNNYQWHNAVRISKVF